MGITEATTLTVDELIRTHGTGILNYATGLMNGDRAAAEDVVQETWLRAWIHFDQLTEQRGSVRGWLTRVAHNIAMDHHRARRSRPSEIAWTDLDTERVVSPDDPAREVEDRLVVDELLGHVSDQHRATITEIYLADHTATVAARTLGVPVGTVKSRVFHALRTMRTQAAAFAA